MDEVRALMIRALFSHVWACMHRENELELNKALKMLHRLRAKQGLLPITDSEVFRYLNWLFADF